MKLFAALLVILSALPATAGMRLSGCTDKNNRAELVGFDLRLGDAVRYYQVRGRTAPDRGLYVTDSDFGGVRVTKVSLEDGRPRTASLRNEGLVRIYPRKRWLSGMRLAGLPVDGYSVQKLFTNSLVMDSLTVDGEASAGKLQYVPVNGRYLCAPGDCRFGAYAIRSSVPGSTIVLNYDGWGENRMAVSMGFGELVLDGAIRFTDSTETYVARDGSSTDSVTATRGCFDVGITKPDGSSPVLAAHGGTQTPDDRALRHLIAWLELMAYDLFAE